MLPKKQLNWGIIGLGNIAHQFVRDLQLVEEANIVCVGSRSLEKASKFAEQYDIPNYCGSYDEVIANREVDVVYIATPHDSHADIGVKAMNSRKHVLCEKPLAVNKDQVIEMVEASRKNNVFLMEALWSKFNPSIKECLHLVKNGAIGDVNYVNADFTFNIEKDANNRMLNMELAGGSLLDMGIYPVFLAYSVFGKPEEMHAIARFHETGADLQTSVVMRFDNGVATVMSGFISQSDMVAKVYGTKGRILIDAPWHETQGYRLIKNGDSRKVELPTAGKGFTYEIIETMNCIYEGYLESQFWSHQHSIDLIEILDEIRLQTGLKYPFE